MANEQKTRQHHPDTQRDFETGTVNPGPGMAGPLSSQDQNPAAERDRNQASKGQSKQAHKEQKNQTPKQSDQGSCGSCGCG